MSQGHYMTPGVYREKIYPSGPVEFSTGVPAFLGYCGRAEDSKNGDDFYSPLMLTGWPHFEARFTVPSFSGYLQDAVRGFFENGGKRCYVVFLKDDGVPRIELAKGLEALEPVDTVDLICTPDIMQNQEPARITGLQQQVLDHCRVCGDRFAILDSLPIGKDENAAANPMQDVLDQRKNISGINGALYFPWLGARERTQADEPKVRYVPPCGHMAGIYARTDERVGVHKAPANEVIEGIVDLAVNVSESQQTQLNPAGINCLRVLPGRGIRVWGARTLSRDPAWTYVNVRRLFLTAGRWIERNMTAAVFEPNTVDLWERITRDLNMYFNDLFQKGALKGNSPGEAFYVKCNAETNPPEARDEGKIISEIGLAPNRPNEFVIVRIIHAAGGVTIAGPIVPA